MAKLKAKGRQGWWFAEVNGTAYPCVHKHWLKGLSYHDPFKRHKGRGRENRIEEAVSAIQSGKTVVLTDDFTTLDAEGDVLAFERKNYIALYEVADVDYSPQHGLRFRLSRRIADLE